MVEGGLENPPEMTSDPISPNCSANRFRVATLVWWTGKQKWVVQQPRILVQGATYDLPSVAKDTNICGPPLRAPKADSLLRAMVPSHPIFSRLLPLPPFPRIPILFPPDILEWAIYLEVSQHPILVSL